jgi:twitching motility protein PilT
MQASDLHLVPDQYPLLRTAGQLHPLAGEDRLSADDLRSITTELIQTTDRKRLDSVGDIDGAITCEDVRYRFNVFKRGRELCVAFRRLDDRFRSLGELGMPESLYTLCDLPDGLIIVAGPTGAGKSTTLAALIDRINRTYNAHIITIEDPVEYVHPPAKSLVNQRQVGADCGTFYDALVASLRQDPDVILVGEIREISTIRTAITAAETGHLVFTTVHAGDCVGVIERLVSVFPAGEQDGVRRQLALVLRAVIAQQLLLADGPQAQPGAHGRRRRVALSEVLLVNPAVANLISTARSAQVYSAMEVGGMHGMQTFEQDLARLLVDGLISEPTAFNFTRNPAVLRERIQRFKSNPALLRRPNPIPAK